MYVSNSIGTSDKKSKAWICYSLAAALCFAACNECISVITSKVSGPVTLIYWSPGGIVGAIIYHLFSSIQNYTLHDGVFWNDMNIVVDGRLDRGNMLAMLCVVCISYVV